MLHGGYGEYSEAVIIHVPIEAVEDVVSIDVGGGGEDVIILLNGR